MNTSTNTSVKVYYFRILSDQDEEFFRDIEILSDQTFQDFHDIIQESIEFEGNELASFYICDREWAKQSEITLIDMGGEELPIFIMQDSRIQEFVLEPHQRLLYEYDFLNPISLFIELMKVHSIKSEKEYPRCVDCSRDMNKSGMDDPSDSPVFKDLKEMLGDDMVNSTEDEQLTDDEE